MDIPQGAVVVGYDGSADAELALAWADEVAHAQHRPLEVLISDVNQANIRGLTEDWYPKVMAEAESDARARLATATATEREVRRVHAPAAEALIEASGRASMVVLGSRGHSILYGALMGSVSQHVARQARCPVVVTRQPYDAESRRVVVGIDGSESSLGAVRFGIEHAERIGGSVTALFGWSRLVRGRSSTGALGHSPGGLAEEVEAAQRMVSEAVAGAKESHPDVEVVPEAVPVAPARALADASQAAALVVVGSRGRGTLPGLLLGATSQSVLHHAHCPVAVVR